MNWVIVELGIGSNVQTLKPIKLILNSLSTHSQLILNSISNIPIILIYCIIFVSQLLFEQSLKNWKMTPETNKQFETSENLQKMVLNIMYTMREKYNKYPEYRTIMRNLTAVSKELNAIRIKEITGDLESAENET